MPGDVAFVKGTTSSVWDVAIGASYKDRGMRNGQHDFFGITFNVPLILKIPEPRWKRSSPGAAASAGAAGTTDA